MCTSVKSKQRSMTEILLDGGKKFAIDLLRCLIVQLHCIFDYLVDFIFGVYYDSKASKVPPVSNPLLLDSAIDLAEKIRKRHVTAEEVVRAFVNRSKEVNGLINAIVEDRFDDAIQDAKLVDAVLRDCPDVTVLKRVKPFLGLPFTTKESNEAKGMIHSMGLLCRRDHRSQLDSTAVSYVKNAGGILIATTNVPEMNLWTESRNNLYGQTRNPYNTTRTVGGSSGGEGAIVAACGTALSIGSDIGGSIRLPAFCNGIFGHKPSEGLTSLKGIGMRQQTYPDSMAEVGPMCKRAKDLSPFLKVLIGDKVSMLKLDEPVDLSSLNVFYQEKSGDIRTSQVNKTMRATLLKAVRHFEGLTGSATKIKIPGSEYSYKLWRYWMTQEDADFKLDITNKQFRTSAKTELYKLLRTGKSQLTLAALLKLLDEDLLPKECPDWARLTTETSRKYLLEKLDSNGVLFYPSAPYPAAWHYSTFLSPYNFGYFCLFNVLKFPACQVPLGLDDDGLPVGIQVVAAPYNDHLCLAVAAELEKAFGGWVPPS